MPRRTFLLSLLAVAALPTVAFAQTLPSATSRPNRLPHVQLREELESLLESGVTRPYGLTFADNPEPLPKGAPPPVVSLDAGGTPAAGLILLLSSQILSDTRYHDASVQVGRALVYAMDPTGRVPPTAVAMPGSFSQKEKPGLYPKRSASFATTGFLLLLDRDLNSQDQRVASGTVRAASWLIKQQVNPGFYATPQDFPKDAHPRRIIRLDLPDTRDALLDLLLVGRTAEGRDTSLPVILARAQSKRAADMLLRLRMTEVAHPSKLLWYPAYDYDGTVIDKLPELPPVGNVLATRYALQSLIAYHLDAVDAPSFAAAQESAQALVSRKLRDNTWPLVDDPKGRYPPPPSVNAWDTGDFGIPPLLRAISDLRVLGPVTFAKVVNRTLPTEQAYAAITAGLTDQFPAADIPISAGQVAPYLAAHPELFDCAAGPIPAELNARTKRLWALYLLTRWEYLFTAK